MSESYYAEDADPKYCHLIGEQHSMTVRDMFVVLASEGQVEVQLRLDGSSMHLLATRDGFRRFIQQVNEMLDDGETA